MKNKLLAIMLGILALLLSACNIEVSTIIRDDQTGEFITEIGLNAEDKAMLSDFEMSPEDFCQDPDMAGDMPEGSVMEIEERGEETWCIFTTSFTSLDELKGLYGDGLIVNRLEVVDDVLYYDVTADLGDESIGGADELGVDIQFLWKVMVPGKLGDHNATSVDGNTLIWDLSTSTGAAAMQAQSDLSSGLGDSTMAVVIAVVCCLCLLVLAGGGAAFFILRKRRETAEEMAAEEGEM